MPRGGAPWQPASLAGVAWLAAVWDLPAEHSLGNLGWKLPVPTESGSRTVRLPNAAHPGLLCWCLQLANAVLSAFLGDSSCSGPRTWQTSLRKRL